MKRCLSILILSMMLFSMFAGLMVAVPETASATKTVTCPAENIDGYINTYHPEVEDSSDIGEVIWTPMTGETARVYLSFDTTMLPPNAVVQSATLYVTMQRFWSAFKVNFYQGDWGIVLGSDDWGCGKDNGTLVGQFWAPSSSPGLVEVSLSPSSVSGSRVQFELTHELEAGVVGIADVYLSEQSSPSLRPYILITYSPGPVSIVYELFGGTTANLWVMPETWAINSTHDCYLFDFDTWDQVDNVSIAKGDANWTLLGYTPYANSTSEDDGYINLTGVIKGATYRVYVSVPTERLSEVYFAVYISSTGEGLPFETFRLRYCSGLTYNNTTAMDVVSPVIYLDYGENWTVAVLDYFGNEITNQSFVTNAALEYISIPVDVHSVKVYNQKDRGSSPTSPGSTPWSG